MSQTQARIALADDHRVVATALKSYLEMFPELRVVGIASSGEELLSKVREWSPEIAIVDLLMPGGINGIETTRRLRLQAPDVRVIALTALADEARMMGVLREGAMGYVRKDADPEILLAAVRAVAKGGTYIDPSVASTLVRSTIPGTELTPREKGVLLQLALGRGNKEIADELGIADETVKSHVSSLLRKLDAENRAQAIVQALKRGLMTIDELG